MKEQEPPAVELASVSKGFGSGAGRLPVLKKIDLRIGTGEFVAVMGASGSGKTTLLNIMGGLLSADEGEVRIAGCDIGAMSDSKLTAFRRENIGFVFQMYNLVDSLDVSQNILLPRLASNRRNASEYKSLFDRIVCRVGLQDRLHHKPSQLSGGEQQRAAVARALINEPALVLADEPTGNLDSENTAALGELFRSLHREDGAAFVLVTHDPAVAIWADRLLVLKDGAILADRPMSEFSSPGDVALFYNSIVTRDGQE